MQNTQQIIWWLEIAKIFVPSLITLIVGYLIFRKTEYYKKDLSKEIEDYKKEISKEIESYKTQLHSDFQTQFYQFQTKFSVFHQRRIETLETLYELVSKVETGIEEWLAFDVISIGEISKHQYFLKLHSDEQNLLKFFDHKRIYFSDEITIEAMDFIKMAIAIIPRYDLVNLESKNLPDLGTIKIVNALNAKGRKVGESILKVLTAEFPELGLSAKSIQVKSNSLKS